MRYPIRVLAYTDQRYWRRGETIYAQRSFVRFVCALTQHVATVTLLGRLSDDPAEEARYDLPGDVGFIALPWYESATDPLGMARAAAGSLRRFWRALDGADVCWLLGPSPFAILFAAIAITRRRRVVLGVRQDLPSYTRSRHPGRRLHGTLADLQEALFRLLARRVPVVTVGTELARGYKASAAVLPLSVSLVSSAHVVAASTADARDYEGPELRLLAVSRLDSEKNPLLLADILALLVADDPRWRLIVAGEGPLEPQLRERIAALGLSGHTEMLGHVDLDPQLTSLYRTSHALLHVSWTEGLPQVLFEAFAAGLPVVATDVGGVADAAGDAAILVAPGEAAGPADALQRIARDKVLRARLVDQALRRARETTIEATSGRLAAFLADPYAPERSR